MQKRKFVPVLDSAVIYMKDVNYALARQTTYLTQALYEPTNKEIISTHERNLVCR